MFKIFKNKEIKISTDEKKIQTILNRGVEKIFPNSDALAEALRKGKKLKFYLGIDPTGPTLHLGHIIPLRKLAQLQELGHEIILLVGGFTAMIGDPDKKDVRQQLSYQQVMNNAKLYQEQAKKILKFDGKNPARFVNNFDWLSKMTFEDILNLSAKMTVQQMLERDMFRRRLKEERPIYIHEFMYPLMQGYDAVVLEVDGEVGGNDQTFNMLAGRHLLKEYKNKEKYVIPMKLLVDNSGAKMGKTTGNMLSLIDSADEKFAKIMSWTDGMILSGFELLTDENLTEIEKRLNSDENPRNIKMDLALNIVSFFHTAPEAEKAKKNWVKQFSQKTVPDNLAIFEIESGKNILEILTASEITKSKKEARRKIDEGAVQIDGEKISDYYFIPEQKEFILKLGKKMIKIKIMK